MPHVELLHAMLFDAGTWEESGVADPVLRVRGELPATARPFVVHRLYRGPQGRYEEGFLLLDPDDVVVFEHPYRLIRLRGEMFEDRFQTRAGGGEVKIEQPGDHTLVLLINGAEVGRVPVFIDAPDSASAAGVLDEAVAAALKKGDILWLAIPQPDDRTLSRPAWYVTEGQRVYVLTGPGEQQLTNIERCDEVQMTVKSKDVHAAIATIPAAVEVVDPDSEEYERVARVAVTKRLNLGEGQEEALGRWRDTCRLVALTPRP